MTRILACLATLALVAGTLAISESRKSDPQPHLKIEVAAKNPWTSLGLNNRPENFQFAIVTDRTGGHRPGIFPAAMKKLNLLQPEFVMSVGDLIEGYTEDRARIDDEWKEFNSFVAGLEMPFFYVPGNHDISNNLMTPIWQEQFGRTYYHFTYHDVLFITLNSEDPPGYTVGKAKTGRVGPEQLAWLKQTLADNRDVRWTLVFIHKPMWQYGEKTNWAEVADALGDRKHTVFAGHHHKYQVDHNGPHTYYSLATTGGGSKLEGPQAGRFDHVMWVTMTPDGPRLANLMLDGIWTDDPVAEAKEKIEARKKALEKQPQ